MADTYGELISRLCQLRDELNKTPEGRAMLADVIDALVYMKYRAAEGRPVTYEEAAGTGGNA